MSTKLLEYKIVRHFDIMFHYQKSVRSKDISTYNEDLTIFIIDPIMFGQMEERVMVVDPVEDNMEDNKYLEDKYSEDNKYLEDKYLETNKYLEDLDSNSLLGGLGLGQETVAQVASYRRVVTSLMGQLQRTARARDL